MGRIYESMAEAINEIERDISEMGIKVWPHTMQNKVVKDDPNYQTLEVQNYSFTILSLKDKDAMVQECLPWCKAEFKERISANFINPGTAWKLRPEVWTEFLVNGKMDYTYNERMNYWSQIDLVIAELTKNPDSRQCLIHVNEAMDCSYWQQNRIPCSVYYQLLVRRERVDIIYNMRSSDFDTHFKNDIWLADELRNYIAKSIGRKPGLFMMNVGSLHRYKNYTKKHVF